MRFARLLAPLAVLFLARTAGGDAPVGQYVLGTQTALDTKTGLRWQRVSSAGVQWQTALTTCSTIQLDGQTGYRLPTVRELESIYDMKTNTGPLWDKTVFSAANQTISAGSHWASNVDGDYAFLVSFVPTQGAYMGAAKKDDFNGARCVKGP